MDDSTDKGTRDLVDDKVVEWRERGVEVEVRRRTNRAGYKAGALHEVRLATTMADWRGERFPLWYGLWNGFRQLMTSRGCQCSRHRLL